MQGKGAADFADAGPGAGVRAAAAASSVLGGALATTDPETTDHYAERVFHEVRELTRKFPAPGIG